MTRKTAVFVGVTIAGVVVDQAAKWWIVHNLPIGASDGIRIVPGFLSIVHAQNPGAAFGLLGSFEYRHWVFLLFTLVAGGVIVDLFRKLPDDDRYMSTTLGLILSGAIGNAIDRVVNRYVTDFIRVYVDAEPFRTWLLESPFRSNEWPSFNVADAALVVGVAMYVLHSVFLEGRKPAPAPAAPTPEPVAEAREPDR